MQITFDPSDLDNLGELLERARSRSYRDRTKALKRIADIVEREAVATVQTYQTDSTGELASEINQNGTAARRWIGADVRQAAFLEYGTPTTGGPRPWLTGPAQKGADELFAEMAAIGEIW